MVSQFKFYEILWEISLFFAYLIDVLKIDCRIQSNHWEQWDNWIGMGLSFLKFQWRIEQFFDLVACFGILRYMEKLNFIFSIMVVVFTITIALGLSGPMDDLDSPVEVSEWLLRWVFKVIDWPMPCHRSFYVPCENISLYTPWKHRKTKKLFRPVAWNGLMILTLWAPNPKNVQTIVLSHFVGLTLKGLKLQYQVCINTK